jgi:hypothetical protein
VTEVSTGGSVPELAFDNQADEGVLLLDGEELVGARQNRVLNITILVGGHQHVVIPVSCVEHGRWRYNSDEFASADRALFSKARSKKMRQVSASMRDSGTLRSDQGEVWADDLPKIVRSHAMDAAETRQPDGVPPVEEAVRRFIEQMKAAATQSFKALGEGGDVRRDGVL